MREIGWYYKNCICICWNLITPRFFRFIFQCFINSIYSFLNGILNLCSFISKGTVNLLNSVYNIQVEKKTANKFVLGSVFFAFLTIGVLGGIKVADYIKDKEITKQQLLRWKAENIQKLIYKITEIELSIKKNLNKSLNITTDFIIHQST